MADNSIESQGTELFLSLDGTTVLKFDCPTALNGIGFTAGEIPNNCLDSVTETSRPGRKKLNAFSVPFIVQEGSEAHEYVLDLVNNATAEVPYAIALSNGTGDYETLWHTLGLVYTAHGALMVIGGLLFGVATLRARVLPSWAAWSFLIGLGINFVLAVLPVPALLETVGSTLRNVGLIGMGAGLMAPRHSSRKQGDRV